MARDSARHDFVIAIPSYKRAEAIVDKTLSLLARHAIPPSQVFTFVADENEKTVYAQHLGSRWPNIVIGEVGLCRQRTFIMKYFPEGTHLVSLDDDVEELYRMRGGLPHGTIEEAYLEVLHAGGLQDIIRDARRKMQKLGVYLWSLHVSDNPAFLVSGSVTLKNGLCNGFFWGCLVRHIPALQLQYGDGHEDVERSLRYFAWDGILLRYQEFCAKTRCKTNKGGIQAAMSAMERTEEERKAKQVLIDEFPLFLKLKESSLGLKFTSPSRTVKEFSLLTPFQFQKAIALKKLQVLVGSLCATFDHLVGCRCKALGARIEASNTEYGMLGLRFSDGVRMLVSHSQMYTALQTNQVVFIELPEPSRNELCLDPVNVCCAALQRVRNHFLRDRSIHNLPCDDVDSRAPEDLSEFERYLASSSWHGADSVEKEFNLFRDCTIVPDFADATMSKYASAVPCSTLNALCCASRSWGGGWGGQCTRLKLPNNEYCRQHNKELRGQGYLTHGRIDGPIPPKKRKEFKDWQQLLHKRQCNSDASTKDKMLGTTMTDTGSFSESTWREMGRGAGESQRAYEFRTGISCSNIKKKTCSERQKSMRSRRDVKTKSRNVSTESSGKRRKNGYLERIP